MPNYPDPKIASNSEAEALSGTSDQETAIEHLPAGVASNSSPSLEVRVQRSLNLMLKYLWGSCALMAVRSASGGLNIDVLRGYYRKSDNTDVTYDGINDFALTDAATNYVYILHSTNLATKSTSSFPADPTTFTPIAIFVCSGGVVVTEERAADRRHLSLYHTNASAAAATGTTGTTFTLDSDNAGAEADQDILFNRGSTDAEDAAIRWVAASDLFRFLTQNSTATRAKVDAAGYQVAGSDVLDTSGDLVAAAISTTLLYTFGANGATPYGILLTPSGSSGAPGSGTHAKGELAIDTDGVLWICTTAGTPGTWKRSGSSTNLQVVSIPDGSGLATANIDITIQVVDIDGNSLSGVYYLIVGAYDDTDGAALAANATISVPSTGSKVRDDHFQGTSSAKVILCKTNSSGQLGLRIVNTIADSVYIIAQAGPQSRFLNCQDVGTITIT